MTIGKTAAALFLMALPASAQTPALAMPVACELGETCILQQFVDRVEGPEAGDFACGGASYDGHKGTDFRVTTAALAKGVEVLAAAPGTVRGTRNDMADRLVETDADSAAIAGRECGNGVVIDHGDGWETQYCHMRRGSVLVKSGDRVQGGQVLGLVGASGQTQFPHLHLSVRKDGAVVDPFDATPSATCGGDTTSLWRDSLLAAYDYQPSLFADAGLAGGAPELAGVVRGDMLGFRPARDLPLVVWGVGVNLQPGDNLELLLSGPDGVIVDHKAAGPDSPKAQWFSFSGKRAPDGGWSPGLYRYQLNFRRGDAVLDTITGSAQMP